MVCSTNNYLCSICIAFRKPTSFPLTHAFYIGQPPPPPQQQQQQPYPPQQPYHQPPAPGYGMFPMNRLIHTIICLLNQNNSLLTEPQNLIHHRMQRCFQNLYSINIPIISLLSLFSSLQLHPHPNNTPHNLHIPHNNIPHLNRPQWLQSW